MRSLAARLMLGRVLHAAMNDDDDALLRELEGRNAEELESLAASASVLAAWARGRANQIRRAAVKPGMQRGALIVSVGAGYVAGDVLASGARVLYKTPATYGDRLYGRIDKL